MKDPIFIIGLGRSGSSILAETLKRSGTVASFQEIWFLDPWHKDFLTFYRKSVGSLKEDQNVSKMVELIFSGQKIAGIHRDFWQQIPRFDDPGLREAINKRILASDRTPGSVFRALVEEITRFRDFDRALVKFPVYFNHLLKLLEWYPDCRVIHIHRDPRATAMSKKFYKAAKSYRFRKAKILFLVLQYNWSSRVYRRYKHLENYRLLHYEDLLLDPEKEIHGLCDFVGLDFQDEMLTPRRGKVSSITGERVKGFDRSMGYRWKEKITPMEQRFITALTRKSMTRFDYDFENHPIFEKETES